MQFPCSRTYFRKSELVKLRSKTLRRRVWFNTLNRIERGLINSVIKVVDMVRSTLLAKVLIAIVKKLLTTLESKVSRMIREIDRPLAKKLSLTAQLWGNKSASEWVSNKGFIQYLTIVALNSSLGYGS